MKIILLVAGIIILIIPAGCAVYEEGPHGHREIIEPIVPVPVPVPVPR